MTIDRYGVYTPLETQKLLKVSASTVMRMLKKGEIRSAKVGKQYRILGEEILRLISPDIRSAENAEKAETRVL